jgi:glycosyltransferase involved in cell wall biosynthesis
MPCTGPTESEFEAPSSPTKGNAKVVWVGRIAKVKRLELLLEVAGRLPGVSFEIAGPRDSEREYFESLMSIASKLPNVTLLGQVQRSKMAEVYKSASLLCCTSHFEGFPNTFIEAWSHGIPVISTVDPDDLISRYNLGIVAHDAQQITDGIRKLIELPRFWVAASGNSRKYYVQNHALDAAMARFENLFLEVLKGITV